MARYNDLPVFHEVYRLILLLFQYTGGFSREYKYSLGQDLKRDGIVLVRNIYRANKCVDKQEHLEAFLDDFEVVKLEVRLCVDLGLLTLRQQSKVSLLMEGIGKLYHRQYYF